ncbi:MAG: A/G-specific adenine glycosylase [Planctomycetes bacterium]|nr:A/G-specific adenine glycosylase [Planctomycetota bacterium]
MAKDKLETILPKPSLLPASKKLLGKALLIWFGERKRDLPWRKTRDPFAIWVSEIMLQQTQVATVIPYFERFLKTFPTIEALASADEQEVLSHWQGLGYYRRARHMHQAAKIIVSDFGGAFPANIDDLSILPGLGRYTRNAILSQAFDARLPILEANTKRVLARLFALVQDIDSSAGNKFLWEAAEEVLPESDIGAFNQAMMELGSLVCTVTHPKCGSCPLSPFCIAKRSDLVSELPIKKKKVVVTQVRELATVLVNRKKILLGKRPAGQRWAGLWEVPHDTPCEGDPEAKALGIISRKFASLVSKKFHEIGEVVHPVTRFKITVKVFMGEVSGKGSSDYYEELAWVGLSEMEKYPKSSPQSKIIAMAVKALELKKEV